MINNNIRQLTKIFSWFDFD